ncbi:MAG: ABC transporter ATP-binding protein [Actinobacteria bacterium]|nr:MAG: ABC transporter ATP-binding protein [Actinomycetota bacterium]
MTATRTALELSVCRDVSVVHGDGPSAVVALEGIDLAVSQGERVALWGPSGSGKTTLLHVLGGLTTPTRGTVQWEDRPLSSLDTAARGRIRARSIAYVFQTPSLLPSFTTLENVAFAARAAGEPALASRAAELLALVGLQAKHDSLPGELSGGEAQRAAIARALGQRPRLLLCDEPTGQLDSDTGARVLDLIDALQAEMGFALVVATHDADVAARYERTVALADGHIVGDEVPR